MTRISEWNKFGRKKRGKKAQEWMFHDGMTDNETMSQLKQCSLKCMKPCCLPTVLFLLWPWFCVAFSACMEMTRTMIGLLRVSDFHIICVLLLILSRLSMRAGQKKKQKIHLHGVDSLDRQIHVPHRLQLACVSKEAAKTLFFPQSSVFMSVCHFYWFPFTAIFRKQKKQKHFFGCNLNLRVMWTSLDPMDSSDWPPAKWFMTWLEWSAFLPSHSDPRGLRFSPSVWTVCFRKSLSIRSGSEDTNTHTHPQPSNTHAWECAPQSVEAASALFPPCTQTTRFPSRLMQTSHRFVLHWKGVNRMKW